MHTFPKEYADFSGPRVCILLATRVLSLSRFSRLCISQIPLLTKGQRETLYAQPVFFTFFFPEDKLPAKIAFRLQVARLRPFLPPLQYTRPCRALSRMRKTTFYYFLGI